jgi:hypothetical protein
VGGECVRQPWGGLSESSLAANTDSENILKKPCRVGEKPTKSEIRNKRRLLRDSLVVGFSPTLRKITFYSESV